MYTTPPTVAVIKIVIHKKRYVIPPEKKAGMKRKRVCVYLAAAWKKKIFAFLIPKKE